jgi:hypothetical protein
MMTGKAEGAAAKAGLLGALGFAFVAIGGAVLLLSILSLAIAPLRSIGLTFGLVGMGALGLPLAGALLILIGLVLRRRDAANRPRTG